MRLGNTSIENILWGIHGSTALFSAGTRKHLQPGLKGMRSECGGC
jgi:hypothetical protein